MREALLHRSEPITFRQWSGKRYAIFSSLGKEVNIGHVDIDICDKALSKSSKVGTSENLSAESLQFKDVDEDELLSESIEAQAISLLSFTTNLDDSSRPCRKLIIKHISNYLTCSLFRESEFLY